jgi:copper homeostasis protein
LQQKRCNAQKMKMGSKVRVEVCVDSVASAKAAERGGAARLELCAGIIEGGTTPSAGLIETTRAAVTIDVHVMIRPRGGDFCYDNDEFRIMQRDIELAKKLQADGVVLGILDLDGNVDIARTRQLVHLARPLAVTFHRAFDMTMDLSRALEDVCSSGADRVLTSGGKQKALQAKVLITQLVKQAGDRIVVMAGSGIKPENAADLIEATGVTEIHVGLKSAVESPVRHRNLSIAMGSVEGREYRRFGVREESVAALCKAVADVEQVPRRG